MRHGWWWQERGEDVLLEEDVLGAAVCGVPLCRSVRTDRAIDQDQSFVLVVTNLRLALMLQPGDSDFSGEFELEESRASGRLAAFVAEHVGGTPDASASRPGRDSAWVDARSRWDSLGGVWNVIPLGMILRVTSPIDDGSQRNQTPGRSRQGEAGSTPTLAPALPLFSPPAYAGGFLSPGDSKIARRGDGSAGFAEEASVGIECYDLRRVDLYFETADAALRVLHLLRGQPFSPERFLHRQLQQVLQQVTLVAWALPARANAAVFVLLYILSIYIYMYIYIMCICIYILSY